MKLTKNKQLRIMVLIALALSVISIAFACVAMKVSLNKEEIRNVWNVEFKDLTIEKEGLVEVSKPTIKATSFNNLNVKLKNNGDKVTYRFKVYNDGGVDAKLSAKSLINSKCINLDYSDQTACSNVSYSLTYNNGEEIKTGDIFKAGFNKELIFTVKYNGNYPTNLELNNLDFMLLFEQA